VVAALAGERPRGVLITGVGSVAVYDVRSQLREAEADYELEVVRVPMDRPQEVARAVQPAAGAQAVALTRGGGSGVQDLDDDGLIAAVASCPVPVLAALGHASDDLVLGHVADALPRPRSAARRGGRPLRADTPARLPLTSRGTSGGFLPATRPFRGGS
jgi:exonuclease VII large subunit